MNVSMSGTDTMTVAVTVTVTMTASSARLQAHSPQCGESTVLPCCAGPGDPSQRPPSSSCSESLVPAGSKSDPELCKQQPQTPGPSLRLRPLLRPRRQSESIRRGSAAAFYSGFLKSTAWFSVTQTGK